MRDKCFIAEHRGGFLKKEQHQLLMKWACQCSENVLNLIGENCDNRLNKALLVAHDWISGVASVGDARKASVDAIAVANATTNAIVVAVARSVGHAVATAHMADHSLRAAEYALKAVKSTGQSIEVERKWQEEQLPPDIIEMVLYARKKIKINTIVKDADG